MTLQSFAQPIRVRRGFTLLEVLLALGLSSLVIVALAMAIDFHLRVLERSRTRVEEGQLARAVLQRIATDLRNAVRPDPLKLEECFPETFAGDESTGSSEEELSMEEETAPAEEETAGDGTQSPSSSESSTTDGSSTAGTSGEVVSAETAEIVSSTVPQAVPGVYGTPDALQVDVSRIARLDEFAAQMAMGGETLEGTPPGGVKTVTYFVIPPTGDLSLGPEAAVGLMRRELDRASTVYMGAMGGIDEGLAGTESLAPEIAQIALEYFDGESWTDMWDSSAMGSLPRAVKISVAIRPKTQQGQASRIWSLGSDVADESEQLLIYSLVVRLSNSEPVMLPGSTTTSEEGSTEGSTEGESSSGSGSGGSSSSGSGGHVERRFEQLEGRHVRRWFRRQIERRRFRRQIERRRFRRQIERRRFRRWQVGSMTRRIDMKRRRRPLGPRPGMVLLVVLVVVALLSLAALTLRT